MRRLIFLMCATMLFGAASLLPCRAQQQQQSEVDKVKKPSVPTPVKEVKPPTAQEIKAGKNPTAEQVAESVIFVYGGRPVLTQIRRNGVEHGRVTRILSDGHLEEITYEQRFVRGDNSAKDKIRLDQKTPQAEFALVYNQGQIWGIINGTAFTPRQEATAGFLSQSKHGLDALLRYKENGSTVTFVGKEKQKNIDMWVIDVTDKENNKTRYYVSAQKARVLWLEYEETPPGASAPIKYVRTFHDYRAAQNTLVPFRSILTENGKQTEETQVLNVTYGIRMDDTFFQNPQAAAITP